jgi:tRNA nucleotidyltransferase (CCA-adding enzyme)
MALSSNRSVSLETVPSMNRLNPPPAVLEIAAKLEGAGFETWCVGGAIRDALLGHPHLDWDLATSATPPQMRDLFGPRRTIPIGVDFGTVGVIDRHGAMHEVTTFRRDVRTDGRHAEVEFGVSIDDDLARRDFTINAIAFSPLRNEVRDPFHGQDDIARKIVRAVGDPEARMREDRLRALRAIRFGARFGFTIDDATRRAIEASAPHLGRLSPERVKQELDKTMEQVRCPSAALSMWQSTGAFASLVPALAAVPTAAFAVPDFLAAPGSAARPSRRANRFAGLLVGLAATQAGDILLSLRASRNETQAVVRLVDAWHRHGREIAARLMAGTPEDALVRRWVSSIGRLEIGSFMRLAAAVWAAARARNDNAPNAGAVRRLYRRMVRSAFRDPIDLGSLAVDGEDLRRLGIPPGRGLGKILQALLETVIADPTRNTADYLLPEAKRERERLERAPDDRGPSQEK